MDGLFRVMTENQRIITNIVNPAGDVVKVLGFIEIGSRLQPVDDIRRLDAPLQCSTDEQGERIFVDEDGVRHAESDCEVETFVRYPETQEEAYQLASKRFASYTPIFAERIKDGVFKVVLRLRAASLA